MSNKSVVTVIFNTIGLLAHDLKIKILSVDTRVSCQVLMSLFMWVDLTMLSLFFRALEHLEPAVELQKEVLDTHEELILTHQAMEVVLTELGRDDEAEKEMDRAGECAKKLDSLEVSLPTVWTGREKELKKTDPATVPSGST